MLSSLVVALVLTGLLFVAFLLIKAYYPSLFRKQKEVKVEQKLEEKETFVAPPPPPAATKVNTPAPPVPAPAPPIQQDSPQEPRVISPGGPSTPNASAPANTAPSMSPEVVPIDPYDDMNMVAPIHDSMRYPELSFGPGVDNTGMNKLGFSGVGSTKALAAESPFSPDFAQNGGSFMGSVTANDLTQDDTYATA
jgi:hypothetical protein